MGPVCGKCNVKMEVEKNGVVYFEKTTDEYCLTSGDEWKCPDCGQTAVVGWGKPWWRKEISLDYVETGYLRELK